MESIVTQPVTTTHHGLDPDERAARAIADSMIRLSVGLEDPGDLIKDLDQALGQGTLAPLPRAPGPSPPPWPAAQGRRPLTPARRYTLSGPSGPTDRSCRQAGRALPTGTYRRIWRELARPQPYPPTRKYRYLLTGRHAEAEIFFR